MIGSELIYAESNGDYLPFRIDRIIIITIYQQIPDPAKWRCSFFCEGSSMPHQSSLSHREATALIKGFSSREYIRMTLPDYWIRFFRADSISGFSLRDRKVNFYPELDSITRMYVSDGRKYRGLIRQYDRWKDRRKND